MRNKANFDVLGGFLLALLGKKGTLPFFESPPPPSGGGIQEYTDSEGGYYSALTVAAEYFRSGADKISIGGDAVYAVEQYNETGTAFGTSV